METRAVDAYSHFIQLKKNDSLKGMFSQKVQDGEKGPDLSEYRMKITQFKLDVLFNTEKHVGTQAEKWGGVDLSLFESSAPENHGNFIASLSPAKASELISEDAYYGITRTAQRIAEFVMNGAGDDLNKLRAGREGIARGFKEAEKAWGAELPDISYKTISKALEQIDERIREMGGSVVDIEV